MNKVKKFSFVLFFTPILFLGCVSEKITSITPEVETDKNVTFENNVTLENNQTVSEAHIREAYKNVVSTMVDGEISFEVKEAKTVINSAPIVVEEELIMQALNFDATWEKLSKKDEILETAKNFLGTKYVWAATGPNAFDCSGFTKYVFKKNGITLPRNSAHQANIGEKIAFSELQKGDLVFFDTEKKFKNKVNHVGIFIGDNKFIHASSAKKRVIITSFAKKKFYRNKFLYARRVINANENIALNITQKDSLFN